MAQGSSPKAEKAQLQSPLYSVLLAFGLIVWRMPARVWGGYLWAEDVVVFLREAHVVGVRAFVAPYAGYLLVVQRLIAWVTLPFPIRWIPYLYCGAAIGVTCAVSGYVHLIARRLTEKDIRLSPTSILIIATAPLIVPHGGEVLLTITNLQWLLAPALFAFLLDALWLRPAVSGARRWARLAWAGLLGFTGPFMVVFAPLWGGFVAWRVWRKQKVDWIFCAVLVFTAAIQMAFIHYATALNRGVSTEPIAASNWPSYFFSTLQTQFAVPMFYGREIFGKSVAGLDLWILWGIPVIVYAMGCAAVRPAVRQLALALVVLALMNWWVGLYRIHNPAVVLDFYGNGARYGYIPEIFVLWGIWLLADNTNGKTRTALVVLGIMPLVSMCTSFNPRYDAWSIDRLVGPKGAVQSRVTAPPTPAWNFVVDGE